MGVSLLDRGLWMDLGPLSPEAKRLPPAWALWQAQCSSHSLCRARDGWLGGWVSKKDIEVFPRYVQRALRAQGSLAKITGGCWIRGTAQVYLCPGKMSCQSPATS